MGWFTLGSAALSAAGTAAKPAGAAPTDYGDFSGSGPINVAPTGVNLGEILKNYTQGSAANGGSGTNVPSRYAQEYVDNGMATVPAKSGKEKETINFIFWGGIAAAGGLLTYLVAR